MSAPTFIQKNQASVGGGASLDVTLTGVGAGSLLIICVSEVAASNRTYSAADDKGNTWAQAAATSTNRGSTILYAYNVAAGDTVITVTPSASATFRIFAIEVAGAETASDPKVASDTNEQATNQNSHHCAAAGSIDATDDVFVVAGGTLNAAGSSVTKNASYTLLYSDGGNPSYLWSYREATGGVTDDRATWTSGTARNDKCCMAAFKAPAAGGGASPLLKTIQHHGLAI